MTISKLMLSRRHFGYAALGGLLVPAMARAADLLPLPRQTEGPYYPDHFPTDTDNDLVRIADHVRDAGGEIFEFSGVVRDVTGKPLPGARVEIWQADAGGRYIHSGDRWGAVDKDADFQGYGQMKVGEDGSYSFRTIRPVAYDLGGIFRTPHIHIKVHRPDERRVITSQLYVAGDPGNVRDMIFRRLSDSGRRAASMSLTPSDGETRWRADFDLVVG